MAESPPPVPLSRVGPPAGRPGLLILLTALAVSLAVLKPWQSDPVGAPSVAGSPATSSAPRPSAPAATAPPTPAPRDADSVDCNVPDAWRLVTVERTPEEERRSWAAVTPLPAGGPTDEAIPVRPAWSADVVAIGFCAPWQDRAGRSVPLPTAARVWSVTKAGARVVRELRLVEAPVPGRAELYRRPLSRTEPSGFWPAGRYVFELLDEGSGRVLWLGIDIAPRPATP